MNSVIACVFPGQGAQSVGMLSALAAECPLVEDTFAEASEVLGRDLWRIVREGPAEVLDRTEHTQPAMLAAGIAVWRVWRSRGGPDPVALAGHSLGEYTALVAAEALSFADAVALVAERARLMQEAVPEGRGAMAAVLGLDDATVEALCAGQRDAGVVEAVNYNAPGQVVIAGERAAVEAVAEAARAAGARRVVPLAVSVPSHSSLMREAAARLGERLAGVAFRAPRWPVLHNVDARPRAGADEVREALARQLHSPVRWTETVRALREAHGAGALLECGPGKVLTGLARRIDRGLEAHAVHDPESLAAALAALRDGGER